MTAATATAREIRYVSPPAPVSMADAWYGVAPLDHFWIQRRFEVCRRLAGQIIRWAPAVADVGCGHGIIQRQIEDAYNREVTGFDLNEFALKQTISRISPVCCYDVFQRAPQYEKAFEIVMLFDVLEHLRDEDAFIQAIKFHLSRLGRIVINVPATKALWSRYDEEDGHFRRYDIGMLRRVAERNGMSISRWTYWGAPMVPLLLARKLWMLRQPREKVIAAGFDSRGPLMNRLLLAESRLEWIPQHLMGTSLMAVLAA